MLSQPACAGWPFASDERLRQGVEHSLSKCHARRDLTYHSTGLRPDCVNFTGGSCFSANAERHSSHPRPMLRPNLDCDDITHASDEVLMEAITHRHQLALEEFYQRHGSRIKSVIGNVVHEEADADDVLQEILIQIWRESGHYSPKAGKLLGWVVTLARRRAIDRLRRKQAYCRAKERYQTHLDQPPPVTPQPPSLANEIERDDMRRY